MKSREDIRDFILLIESKFPVNIWKINDVHLWPLIRLELFFQIRKELYHSKKDVYMDKINESIQNIHSKPEKVSRVNSYLKLLKKAFKYFVFIKKLKEKPFVFFAHSRIVPCWQKGRKLLPYFVCIFSRTEI